MTGQTISLLERAIYFPYGIAEWFEDGCAGDFNNDGIDDFTFNGDNNNIFFFISNGEGGFDFSSRSDCRSQARGTDCADFNNDGILDIFRASYNNPGYIQFLEGNGDGSFKAPVDFLHTGEDTYGVALADFDNDGDIDRICNTGGGGDPYFYENTGTVFFATATNVVSLDYNNHGGFDAFDYDGDGNEDIVCTDYSWTDLRFYRSNGDLTFTNVVILGSMPGYSMAVSAPPLPQPADRPAANVSPAVQHIAVNAAAAFDASASSSTAGDIVSNRWDFGDGTATPWLPAASSSVTSHTFTAEGHYRVRMDLRDEEGYGGNAHG